MKANLTTTLCLTGLAGALCFSSSLQTAAAETASTNAAASSATQGAPLLQFESTFYDFGKISALGTVAGVFKFKNGGTGVLKIEPPRPSCGCTDAKVTPDTLAPGESGEITYHIKLDHPTGAVQKTISIYSNDPQNPDIQLTMALDCTPLYNLSPKMLRLVLPPGKDEIQASFTIERNDGKPAEIQRLTSTHPAVSATLDSSVKPDSSSDQINVTVHRPANAAPKIVSNIQIWADGDTNEPMQTLVTWCDVQGELTATPTQMYWVLPNLGNSTTNYPDNILTHTLKLKSLLGQPVEIKSVTTDIKGMSTQVVSKDNGKNFDLILKFDQMPHGFTTGNVTIETGSASLPKLQVPVTVAVSQ